MGEAAQWLWLTLVPHSEKGDSLARILVNYRRNDSVVWVERLGEALRERFASSAVSHIDEDGNGGSCQQLFDQCSALLVVIGPEWFSAADAPADHDFLDALSTTRQLVAKALRHDVPVFPVLVNGADMPGATSLPDDIKTLAQLQCFRLRVEQWRDDVARLVNRLSEIPELAADAAAGAVETGAAGRVVDKETVAILVDGEWMRSDRPTVDWPAGTVFRDAPFSPEMVVIPAGMYMMGSPASERGRGDNEGPLHRVVMSRPIAVGRYAVTFDEWDAFTGATDADYRPMDTGLGRGARPVINVSWEDATRYVEWLSRYTGQPYRLLSEAEWEYAARAGSTTCYPWGDEPGRGHANFKESGSQWSGTQLAPAGSFAPNTFGLYDMIGNVWEWCEDCWNGDYAGAPVDGSAWLAGDCTHRVVRGGGWFDERSEVRCAFRFRSLASFRSIDLGLRVARSLPAPERRATVLH